ncbi:MAG TPA: NAD(P)H-dependent oxidoreductase [Candidatus Nitrosocosmicus sp.]
MDQLKIITSTTRPGRKGVSIANWIAKLAKQEKHFETELLDLAEINLPFMDEPNHPRLKQYQQEHTKKWSAVIDGADAFIIVLSEYNFGFPAPIKNALDYLFNEWRYKPVAFVSYGGVSGGLRSTQMLKQVVTALNMVPIVESLSIPFFTKFINNEGEFNPEDIVIKSAHVMFTELARWSEALKTMRKK